MSIHEYLLTRHKAGPAETSGPPLISPGVVWAVQSLPFDFNYGGILFASGAPVRIHQGGVLDLVIAMGANPSPIQVSALPALAVWTQGAVSTNYQGLSGSGVWTRLEGVAPYRRWVITWRIIGSTFQTLALHDEIDASITLHESLNWAELSFHAFRRIGATSTLTPVIGAFWSGSASEKIHAFNGDVRRLGGSDGITGTPSSTARTHGGARIRYQPRIPLGYTFPDAGSSDLQNFDPTHGSHPPLWWRLAEREAYLNRYDRAVLFRWGASYSVNDRPGYPFASSTEITIPLPHDKIPVYEIRVAATTAASAFIRVEGYGELAATWYTIGSGPAMVNPTYHIPSMSWTGLRALRISVIGSSIKRLDWVEVAHGPFSNWQEVSVGQIAQDGAAVNADFFRRLWRNSALRANRPRGVFSAASPDASDSERPHNKSALIYQAPVASYNDVSKVTWCAWAGLTNGAIVCTAADSVTLEPPLPGALGNLYQGDGEISNEVSMATVQTVVGAGGVVKVNTVAAYVERNWSEIGMLEGIAPPPRASDLAALIRRQEKEYSDHVTLGLAAPLGIPDVYKGILRTDAAQIPTGHDPRLPYLQPVFVVNTEWTLQGYIANAVTVQGASVNITLDGVIFAQEMQSPFVRWQGDDTRKTLRFSSMATSQASGTDHLAETRTISPSEVINVSGGYGFAWIPIKKPL